MKKAFFTTIAVCVVSICAASAQTVNALDSIDEQQRQKAIEVSQAFVKVVPIVDNDVEVAYDGNNTGGRIVSARPIFATQLGIALKGAYQGGEFFPEIDAVLEQHTKHFILSGVLGARVSRETPYQNEPQKTEIAANVQIAAFVTFFKSANKHFKLSVGAFDEFPLTGQKHSFESHTESYDFSYSNSYKGRTNTFGGAIRADWAPGFQKGLAGFVQLNVGRGLNYDYNNDKVNELHISLTAAFTFNLWGTRR